MTQMFIDIFSGFLVGGLAISTVWGFFWLTISLLGLSRGTCGWPIVLKGFVGGLVPLLLLGVLVWWVGRMGGVTSMFVIGLLGMPMILGGLWLRPMADGQRAGAHLMAGVRHLKGELLGTHQGCGGCSHEHDHETCR